jgi:hypothetical protein
MAKANITLPNGTTVVIEGTPEEVQQLLAMYSGGIQSDPATSQHIRKRRKKRSGAQAQSKAASGTEPKVDLVDIVNIIRTCDEAEAIEKNILNKTNVTSRVLMPLWIVHDYKENAFGLTSGEISKITTQLGVPIGQPNASRCLSGDAKAYVIGDKIRVKGEPVRYKLHRRGVQHLAGILQASKDQKD